MFFVCKPTLHKTSYIISYNEGAPKDLQIQINYVSWDIPGCFFKMKVISAIFTYFLEVIGHVMLPPK